jgi:hypothetical protein
MKTMKAAPATAATRIVRKSRDLLIARGYYVVAGSPHGLWSLVGVRVIGTGPATILVAVADRRPSPSIMGAVQGLRLPGAVKMIHVWRDEQVAPEEIVVTGAQLGTRRSRVA